MPLILLQRHFPASRCKDCGSDEYHTYATGLGGRAQYRRCPMGHRYKIMAAMLEVSDGRGGSDYLPASMEHELHVAPVERPTTR